MSSAFASYDKLDPATLRGRGTAKWSFYDPDVLPLWVAEMDFPTAPVVRAAIQDAVDREEFGYPRRDEATGLPDAVAEWSATRYSWPIDPSRIHLLPDVLKGVELAIDCYTSPGSPIVLPTPAYMPFFEVPKVVQRPILEVPMARDEGKLIFDLEAIDRAFASGAESIIVCQPYNPLGRSFSGAELVALAHVVDRHGARVVADEIHGSLTYSNRHVPYASVSEVAASHAITLTSASKAWNLPGLKCAQAIVNNDSDEDRWQQISRMRTHGASTIGIEANLAAYRSGADWLDHTVAYLDGNRRRLAELLAEHLPGVGYSVPEGTYLAWLDCNALNLPQEPAEFFLARARVATNPGLAFGSNGTGCLRLNFATSSQILEQAVTAMGAAVRGSRRSGSAVDPAAVAELAPQGAPPQSVPSAWVGRS
ncbi:MAG TPA: MalY/PatB family protein [Acidimicrobiales bacterium]